MLNWENGNEEIFHLAQKVHGWGRIHAVRYLKPETEEIRKWLLDEGIDNTILPAYSALAVAKKINLPAVIQKAKPDSKEFRAAGKILCGMMHDVPIEGIDAYKHHGRLTKQFLEKAGQARPEGTVLEMVFHIQLYAEAGSKQKISRMAEDILASPACLSYLAAEAKKGRYVFLAAMQGIDCTEGVKTAFRKDCIRNAHLLHLLKEPQDIQEAINYFIKAVPAAQLLHPENKLMGNEATIAYETILQVIDENQAIVDEQELLLLGLSIPVVRCRELCLRHLQNLKKQDRLNDSLRKAIAAWKSRETNQKLLEQYGSLA